MAEAKWKEAVFKQIYAIFYSLCRLYMMRTFYEFVKIFLNIHSKKLHIDMILNTKIKLF